MGSMSRGGEEAMDISLVEDMEGKEHGPPDTWPESLELGADTVSNRLGYGASCR